MNHFTDALSGRSYYPVIKQPGGHDVDDFTIKGQSDYWIDSMLADADQLRVAQAVKTNSPRQKNFMVRAARKLATAFKGTYGTPATPSRRSAA